MEEKLPRIELHGTPREIGLQHGSLLKDRIKKTITYYHGIFNKPEEEIFDAAMRFKQVISEFNKDYSEEIEGIAEGAGVNSLWIYALNARSEILTQFVTECTAVYFSGVNLLAQNWDWASALEELMVIMKITREDGHSILQITEPGILAKIGINSAGLGVTLNFLHMDEKLIGLPVHITLRHFLDSSSLRQGLESLGKYKYGKSANIIFANNEGKYYNLEFANDVVHETSDTELFIHTNHFLSDKSLNTDDVKLASSYARYERAKEMVVNIDPSILSIKKILSDSTNNELPICRPYVPHEDIGDSGTVTSIIMDLDKLEIHATPGNPIENDYKIFKL